MRLVMCAENVDRLLRGRLFVADVGQHALEEADAAARRRPAIGRPCARHQRAQPERLEQHGLAAGVRARDHEPLARRELDVVRHRVDAVEHEQRVARGLAARARRPRASSGITPSQVAAEPRRARGAGRAARALRPRRAGSAGRRAPAPRARPSTRCSSRSSSDSAILSRLPCASTARGSTNTLAPLWLVPCTMPGTRSCASRRTGST